MDLEHLLPGIIGAFVGVVGWLGVGLYIQRRQFGRQARTAARAVYFEVEGNRAAIDVARSYGSFTPLARSAFERLLPELAMLLDVDELRRVAEAYRAHAGYAQAESAPDLPGPVRRETLSAIAAVHRDAVEILARRAFSPREARSLIGAAAEAPESSSAAITPIANVEPPRR
jgi:hypothetical protein